MVERARAIQRLRWQRSGGSGKGCSARFGSTYTKTGKGCGPQNACSTLSVQPRVGHFL